MYKLRLACLSLVLVLVTVSCVGENNTLVEPADTSTSTTTPASIPVMTLTPAVTLSSQVEENTSPNRNCIKPFREFAYTVWDLRDEVDDVQVMLPPPWKIEATIPMPQIEGYYAPHINDVVLARSTNEGQEIWIAQKMLSASPSPGSETIFTIYQPTSQSWKNVPANIDNTDYYVSDLFVTRDGSIWGSTTGEYNHGDPVPTDKVPVLSKFNESTQRFEFAPGVLDIIPTLPDDPKSGWFLYFDKIDIVLDGKQDIFWIFSEKDGIYRYDPATQVTQKWLDLPDLHVTSLALSSDGNIFVEDFRWERMTEPYFHLYEGSLFQFFPDTRELVPLEMPDEPWPVFSGWLVTQTGRLWMGTIGYWDLSGSWHLLHPSTEEFFKHAGDQAWATPHLMLESSDGLLWYRKSLDMGPSREGTAWYNPETGKGCMFTNLAVDVIEDSEHQLWLAAEGNLYRYPLEP